MDKIKLMVGHLVLENTALAQKVEELEKKIKELETKNG